MDPSSGVEEGAEAEVRSLRRTFAERRLSLRDMDAPLRLATGGAIASLVGAALLIALRDVGSSTVVLLPNGGVRTTLSTPLFVATLVLLAIGFAYIATGAVLAHRGIGLLAIAALTFAMGWETGVLGLGFHALLPGWAVWTTRGLLAAIWVIALSAMVWRRTRHGDDPADSMARLVVLALYCGAFGGYLVVVRVASPSINGLTLFPGSINLLMSGLILLVTPILWVAAVDFGEWGQLSGERLHAVGSRISRAGRSLVPIALCIALITVAWITARGSLGSRMGEIGQSALLFALATALIASACIALGARHSTWPDGLSFAGVLAVAALAVVLVPDAVQLIRGDLTVRPSPEVSATGAFTAAADVRSTLGSTGFTILVPAGWQVSQSGSIDKYTDTAVGVGNLALLVDHEHLPTTSLGALSVVAGFGPVKGTISTRGALQSGVVASKAPVRVTRLWLATVPASIPPEYFFIGEASGADTQTATRELSALVNSFRAPGALPAHVPLEAGGVTSTQAQQTSSDRFFAATDVAMIVLAALAFRVMFVWGRGWPGRVRASVLLFLAITVFGVFYDLDSWARLIAGSHSAWPTPHQPGVMVCIAIVGLIVIAWSRRSTSTWARRAPATVAGLVGGILVLRLIEELYNHALAASRVSVWAAIIVLAAMAWDVTMSGESMTNHASKYVPRSSRIFLFFGYVILLACAVVFFSGQRLLATGAQVSEVIFEPESFTQAGLFGLAMPLLVLLFGLRTFAAPHALVRDVDVPTTPPEAQRLESDPDLAPEIAPERSQTP